MPILWLYNEKEVNEQKVIAETRWIDKGIQIGKKELLKSFLFSWKSLKDMVRDNLDYFSWLWESDRYKIIEKIFWEDIPKEWDEYFDILKALDRYEIDIEWCYLDPSIKCCPSWCPEYGRYCSWPWRETAHKFF